MLRLVHRETGGGGPVTPRLVPKGGPVGGAVLVLADATSARERLVTDLVLLGYKPVMPPDGLPPPTQPGAGVALILTSDVRNDAIPRTDALRRTEAGRSIPLIWLVDEPDLPYVVDNAHLLDEFLTRPYPTAELGARLALMWHRSADEPDDVVRRGPLVLHPLSYQVRLDGRALDLTFMEYELLKLLMGSPGRVYRREEVLSLVWGYDYFGGMRTVDVHVRRVRAKLGQDHAWLIETVRGGGYRLAEVRR
jgi:DNA-binding response OmpR family regulator